MKVSEFLVWGMHITTFLPSLQALCYFMLITYLFTLKLQGSVFKILCSTFNTVHTVIHKRLRKVGVMTHEKGIGFLGPGVVAAGEKIKAGGVWEDENDGVPGGCSSGVQETQPEAFLAKRLVFSSFSSC